MSKNKKDLTRIEDLGEFLHDLTEENVLPDLPESDQVNLGSEFISEDDITFGSSEVPETDSLYNTEDTPSIDFGSDFNASPTEEITTTDFDANDFVSSPPTTDKLPEETPHDFGSVLSEDDIKLDEAEENPSPRSQITETYKSPETFEDLKRFSENSSFTGMAAEGNPSFSVLIKNVRFIEDVNDIVTLLKELKLIADEEEVIKGRLMRGMLLVPRISEYAAIFLTHKLRRFDIDIQLGLSDEIHPPKHQETPEIGIVSKFNLFHNQSHQFHFDDPKLEISQIIVSATQGLEGHQVVRYLGVASEHKMLSGDMVEDEASEEVPRHYTELAQKLKAHALKVHANAVVGLNYQLTPLPSEFGVSGHKYRLTCTGNLVWVNKL